MSELLIDEFSPLFLTLERVGPFQDSLYEIDFTDGKSQPCNFYLLIAANGFGKTTVLNSIATAMDLLSQENHQHYGIEDLDHGEGRIQLDVSVRYRWKDENHRIVLSIIAGHIGEDVSLKVWGENTLEKFEAESWHRLGYIGTQINPLPTHRSDALMNELLAVIQYQKNLPPDGFNESAIPVPTVLNFSAYRDIPPLRNISGAQAIVAPEHWGYQSAHHFSAHNESWTYSLDNLLVWLKWLDDGRFEKACDLLNKQVFSCPNPEKKSCSKYFSDIQRDPPQAIIKTENGEHRLDRLSSGEKSLVQIFLRIAAHMTQNTIVLIDEFDAHLHIRWQYKLFNALKKLAASEDAKMTIIVTSHSTEILETYISRMNIIEEDGRLIKGGHFIEKGMKD